MSEKTRTTWEFLVSDLLPEEITYLADWDSEAEDGRPRRCPECGHLEVLHCDHRGEFCCIPDCLCEWGELGAPRQP